MRITLSPTATLFHADCREALRALPSNSLDSCCTDPPYALVSVVKRFGGENAAPAKGNDAYMRASAGFMQRTWDTGEVAFDPEFWREVWRVLKPGGHVAAFGGTRSQHRLVCAIEDAGFEIRDQIYWHYGQGFPKSQNVAKFIDKELGATGETIATGDPIKRMIPGADQNKDGWIKDDGREFTPHDYSPASPQAQEFDGFGTALKPATEPICLARKPLSEKTVAANVLKWRTGALNIDGCRVEAPGVDLGRNNNARKQEDGTSYVVQKTAMRIDNSGGLGRWPANVVTDGSDEVVGMFPSTASGSWNGKRNTPKTKDVFGGFPKSHDETPRIGDSGSAARFFFNTSTGEKCTQSNASDAESHFPLSSELAVSVLSNVVAQSMPLWALQCIDSPAHSMSVTPSELRRISEQVIETIQFFDERCSPESLPKKLSRSDNLVSIAAIQERTDTILITISPSKLSGNVEPATFSITRQNSAVGAKDSAPSSARFHYSAKASRADRNGSKHPTVKPIALMQWLARLITPPGGTILDPFAGSGTTGAAAALEGFNCILCEREAEYVRDIQARFQARFPSAAKPRLVIPLATLRQELALLPAVEALRARLRA